MTIQSGQAWNTRGELFLGRGQLGHVGGHLANPEECVTVYAAAAGI
jgi:hypothetical protein